MTLFALAYPMRLVGAANGVLLIYIMQILNIAMKSGITNRRMI